MAAATGSASLRERMKRRISVCGMGMSMSAPMPGPTSRGRSRARPSERSMSPSRPQVGSPFPRPQSAARRDRRMPSLRRGAGRRCASQGMGHSLRAARHRSSSSSRPARARPVLPMRKITSPGCASPRRSVFSACPNTVRQRWSLSARERSPPTSGTEAWAASSAMPAHRPSTRAISASGGRDRPTVNPIGRAPSAARSLRLTARAFQPISSGVK